MQDGGVADVLRDASTFADEQTVAIGAPVVVRGIADRRVVVIDRTSAVGHLREVSCDVGQRRTQKLENLSSWVTEKPSGFVLPCQDFEGFAIDALDKRSRDRTSAVRV